MGLAFFSELNEFVHRREVVIRSFIKGNQVWPQETLIIDAGAQKQLIGSLDWLQKGREVARYLGVNPLFPEAETINANGTESKDVQLMIKLIESGFHEQSNDGQIVCISCDNPYSGPEVGTKQLATSMPEPYRKINFFGMEIPFGPLVHTWTDLELISICPVGANRTEMTFKGGANGIWKIEYKRLTQPNTTEPENRPPSP